MFEQAYIDKTAPPFRKKANNARPHVLSPRPHDLDLSLLLLPRRSPSPVPRRSSRASRRSSIPPEPPATPFAAGSPSSREPPSSPSVAPEPPPEPPFAAARRSPSRRPGAALRRGPQVTEPPPPPFDAARRFPSRQRTPPRPPAAPEPQRDGPNPEIHNTGGLSRRGFPAGFVFGTAASAYQVEGMARQGGRGPSIWDAFAAIPGTIAGNGTADVTVDEYHRYKEDVSIMKEMGFDAYRFSISWSNIYPDGTGKVNQEGVDYYSRLIDYMLQQDEHLFTFVVAQRLVPDI
ncbi:klotho [Triticum aestivum]|uniref:klotho n=1 Tax=Triticum aestivum TaxID=4565 RepID=UPI001D0197E8|nr:klotho-like [Triticum aestivum]